MLGLLTDELAPDVTACQEPLSKEQLNKERQ
jgi:hypothetical protein